MKTIEELREAAKSGLSFLQAQADVKEAEVFVSANEQLIGRIDFKSDIPSNGLLEPKSASDCGLGMQVLFKPKNNMIRVGFASEPNDLTLAGFKRALVKARQGSVRDPDFVHLPAPPDAAPRLSNYADPHVMNMTEAEFVEAGWRAVLGALEVFKYAGKKEGIVIGGDITVLKERIAVANTRGIDDSDETSILMAAITSMLEKENVKGTGWNIETHWGKFTPKSASAESGLSALSCIGGECLDSGQYEIIFGPQAIAELMTNLVVPALKLSNMDASASWLCGHLGERVCWEHLTIYDDGSVPGLGGSKRITCEGLPTGRTDLIRDGILVGLLANNYYANKCSSKFRRYTARSGFRFQGHGRHFTMTPGISATNLIIQGAYEKPVDELEKSVRQGIYVGRLWYCYPVNGLAAGDFTCTVVGDSYLIKDGRRVGTIRPNTLRISDNIVRVLQNIIDVTNLRRPTITWGGEEVIYAPCMAVRDVRVEAIGKFLNRPTDNGGNEKE